MEYAIVGMLGLATGVTSYRYGLQQGEAACDVTACHEVLCYYKKLQTGADIRIFEDPMDDSEGQAWNLPSPDESLGGGVAIHNTETIDVYDGSADSKCNNPQEGFKYECEDSERNTLIGDDVAQRFCANDNGCGVTGSWNELEDADDDTCE